MHIVVFTSAEGKPGYFQTETLEDAVKFVERARNSEGVVDARLYRMTEVPLEIKTYIKVEVAAGSFDAVVANGTDSDLFSLDKPEAVEL